MGECWLRRPDIASLVQNALIYHHDRSYDLHAWVIMPNHGHVLATQLPGKHLPDILHSIKSYTATTANKILSRRGAFWQHESFDRYIRNYKHYANVIEYIENNPVKAGLCERKEDWQWQWIHWRVSILLARALSVITQYEECKGEQGCSPSSRCDRRAGMLTLQSFRPRPFPPFVRRSFLAIPGFWRLFQRRWGCP